MFVLRKMVHVKCRNGKYPLSDVQRLIVPEEQTQWSSNFDDYKPPIYNSSVLKNKPWSDLDIDDPNFKPKWNELDGNVNRKSHLGIYEIKDKYPLNPEGRTGLQGRGILGKWGPNHAADPIVTRWKLEDGKQVLHGSSKLPILQFCAIQRHDCNEWAIPGGMIDPGENVSQTLMREFMEEAMNSLQNKIDSAMLKSFFEKGVKIYEGYVDDPRNTDNAWMETVAYNFHDDDGNSVGKFSLKAGDDAKNVRWMDVDKETPLYASHSNFVFSVTKLRNAHW